jgi:glycosyltransferase involved in cell wall biosynthesis
MESIAGFVMNDNLSKVSETEIDNSSPQNQGKKRTHRIVSMLAPIRCGVYSIYKSLSAQLEPSGYSFTWLCSGTTHRKQLEGPEADANSGKGEVVADRSDNAEERTRALIERLTESSPDIVIYHALGDQVDFNSVRYLPSRVRRILVMHSNSLACYRAAREVRNYVDATVAISPRIKDDLARRYGFQDRQIALIPNGIDSTRFSAQELSHHPDGRLRILSHGRIDYASKGLRLLPEIFRLFLRHATDFELTVSGDGPDLPDLKRRIGAAGLSDRTRFLGWTDREQVPGLMRNHDVLLFPSRFEGFGTVLIEAMAGGCLPIASVLPGVSTWIIEDGRTGLLFPIDDVKRAAAHLRAMYANRSQLDAMREKARKASTAFSLQNMTNGYERIFQQVLLSEDRKLPALSTETCSLPPGLRSAGVGSHLRADSVATDRHWLKQPIYTPQIPSSSYEPKTSRHCPSAPRTWRFRGSRNVDDRSA